MRFTLMLMIRLIALGGLGSSVVAIGLSRAHPKAAQTDAVVAPRFYGISGGVLFPGCDRDFLLDAETGRVREANFGPGVLYKFVISVPWREESGRHMFLGRFSTLTGTGSDTLINGSSLAVMGLDGGVARELPEPESAVAGFPCWLPGQPDRIIFPAGDCRLYVQELERRENLLESREVRERRPRAIDWRCKAPGEGAVFLCDPTNLPGPRHGVYIAVSLASIRMIANKPRFRPFQLWWLELDPLDQSIVDAGMLTAPSCSDERLPSFARSPAGTPCLAYLSRSPGTQTMRLMLAPIAFDGRNGSPKVRAEQVREVSEDVAATLPVFSSDGRWLCEIRRNLSTTTTVSRIEVGRALGESTSDAAR